MRDGGRPAESLAWFARAIATLAPAADAGPRLVFARLALRNAHGNRAKAYDLLGWHVEAIPDEDGGPRDAARPGAEGDPR